MGEQAWVPPSSLAPGSAHAGVWQRGIPTPLGVMPTQNCADVFGPNAPTLVERYDIYSYSIGYGLAMTNTAAPIVAVELVFLINGRVAYRAIDEPNVGNPGGGTLWIANGAFVSDLTNPLRLDSAHTRLSLQAGYVANLPDTGAFVNFFLGSQADPSGNPAPYESTISYDVVRVGDTPISLASRVTSLT